MLRQLFPVALAMVLAGDAVATEAVPASDAESALDAEVVTDVDADPLPLPTDAEQPVEQAASSSFELYQPQDKDERGLWMTMDEAERDLKMSPAVIRDPDLNAYVRGVLCRTVGEDECRHVRLYLIRTPHFNATMAPNGVMQVWSGLLLRMENEAQLAAVLGHEYTHFRQRHSVQLFREAKEKTNAAAWLSFTGIGLIASFALIGDFFEFSRDMEREADAGGLKYMAAAGYDVSQAAVVWERLRAEMDATALARNTKSRKDKNGGLFASHPPTAERVETLRAAAVDSVQIAGGQIGDKGEERFRAALAGLWPDFVDDQLKLNDFGASDFLITSLGDGQAGWTPELLYARAELYRRQANPESMTAAVTFYSRAIDEGAQLPELWRGRGLALLKLGEQAAAQTDLKEYIGRAPGAADRGMMAMLAGAQ